MIYKSSQRFQVWSRRCYPYCSPNKSRRVSKLSLRVDKIGIIRIHKLSTNNHSFNCLQVHSEPQLKHIWKHIIASIKHSIPHNLFAIACHQYQWKFRLITCSIKHLKAKNINTSTVSICVLLFWQLNNFIFFNCLV